MHASRIVLRMACFFILGTAVGAFVVVPSTVLVVGTVLSLLCIALFWRRNWHWVYVGFLMFITTVGLTRSMTVRHRDYILPEFAEAAANVRSANHKHDADIVVRGIIKTEPSVQGMKQRFVFSVGVIESQGKIFDTNEKMLVTTDSYPRYSYGDTLRTTGVPQVPKNFDASSSFDYAASLHKDDIYTIMNYPHIERDMLALSRLDKATLAIMRPIFHFKNIFLNGLRAGVVEPEAAFIEGTLLGARSNVPQSIQDDFQNTGTSHILAISGYNITIVAGVMSALLLLVVNRRVAFWFTLFFIILFVIITGSTASVVRAGIMSGMLLLAQRQGRLYDARPMLVLTAAVMMYNNPQIVRYDIGFQLSFLATVGIVYIQPLFEGLTERMPHLLGMAEACTTTIAAQICTLPLLVFYFNKISIISFLVNAIIVPTIPYTMLLGCITAALALISLSLARLVGLGAWLVAVTQLRIIHFFAHVPFAVLRVTISAYSVALIYAGIILILLVAMKRRRVHYNNNAR